MCIHMLHFTWLYMFIHISPLGILFQWPAHISPILIENLTSRQGMKTQSLSMTCVWRQHPWVGPLGHQNDGIYNVIYIYVVYAPPEKKQHTNKHNLYIYTCLDIIEPGRGPPRFTELEKWSASSFQGVFYSTAFFWSRKSHWKYVPVGRWMCIQRYGTCKGWSELLRFSLSKRLVAKAVVPKKSA